mmetsp:Transcript_32735/g.53459  ORF Transcript_32735/g.53459 Transcript_32735/m.53459 type:complete len:114 (+) Transcript_32735:1001-1342(+)
MRLANTTQSLRTRQRNKLTSAKEPFLSRLAAFVHCDANQGPNNLTRQKAGLHLAAAVAVAIYNARVRISLTNTESMHKSLRKSMQQLSSQRVTEIGLTVGRSSPSCLSEMALR